LYFLYKDKSDGVDEHNSDLPPLAVMSPETTVYVRAGVDIIHTLAELADSLSDILPVPGLGPAAKLVKEILNVCNEVSGNK
jgi:hypothetical protein